MIKLKRAYDPVSKTDGRRFLVERLWPRAFTKAKLHVDGWLKEVGPSTPLRKWFGHDPEKWDSFRTRYARELGSRPEAWQPIVSAARRGPSHSSTARTTRNTTMRSPCSSTLRARMRRRTTPEPTVARLRRSRR